MLRGEVTDRRALQTIARTKGRCNPPTPELFIADFLQLFRKCCSKKKLHLLCFRSQRYLCHYPIDFDNFVSYEKNCKIINTIASL